MLDSRFLSRVGNLDVLLKVSGLGFVVVLAVVLVAADAVEIAGWVPVICFGVWAVLTFALVALGMLRRAPSTLMSPAARIAIGRNLPASKAHVVRALERAQSAGRELIADLAVFEPLNKHGGGFAARVTAFHADVRDLLGATELLDDQWSVAWDHIPTQRPAAADVGPLTIAMKNELVAYLGHKMWVLQWAVDYLTSGSGVLPAGVARMGVSFELGPG